MVPVTGGDVVSKAAHSEGVKDDFCSVDDRMEALLDIFVSINPSQWKVGFCVVILFYRSPQMNRHIIGSSTKGTSS